MLWSWRLCDPGRSRGEALYRAENVTIGKKAVVGAMPKDGEKGVATVGSGVVIGDGAIVGPNAMVNKNVEGGEEQW